MLTAVKLLICNEIELFRKRRILRDLPGGGLYISVLHSAIVLLAMACTRGV